MLTTENTIALEPTYQPKKLRPYQENAIALARQAIIEGKSPLLIAPTGSGKSPIQLTIANNCIKKGGRALIVVPLQPLINQFYCSAMEWIEDWYKHGISIYAGSQSSKERDLKRSRLCIAMAQTIESRYSPKPRKACIEDEKDGVIEINGKVFKKEKDSIKLPWKPDVIIYDEAHLTLFRDAFDILQKEFPQAQTIALTATPWRMDGRTFPDNSKWIQVTTTRDLINNQKFLTPYEVYNLCNFKLKSAKKNQSTNKDYTVTELEEIIDSATPSKVWEEWQSFRDKHTIAFAPSKKVAKVYADYFIAQGQQAIVINDETPLKEREEAYRRFREEKIVLFSVTVLAVGFDQPCATVALLLRPTKSLALLVQMLGRVLRLHPNKDKAYILDFTGTTIADGMYLPADIEDWQNLPTQSGRECPECHFVNGAGQSICKNCGYEFPKTERERLTPEEVTKINVEDLFALLEERRKEITDDRKLMLVRSLGTTEEESYKFFKQRAYFQNYAPGKAYIDFKEKFDKEPGKGWDTHAIFIEPEFEDMLLYYAYLDFHAKKKNKPSAWVNGLMKNEFAEFMTVERWTALLDFFKRLQ